MRYLRGRFREALNEGGEALEAAIAAGDRRSESEVLNTLGMARIVTGAVDEGIECLRRAIEIAREDDDIDGVGNAYSNLADTLSLAGRTSQALETAKEGMAARRRGAAGARLDVADGFRPRVRGGRLGDRARAPRPVGRSSSSAGS